MSWATQRNWPQDLPSQSTVAETVGQGARAAETGRLAPQASCSGQDRADQRLPDVQTSQSTRSARQLSPLFEQPQRTPADDWELGTAGLRALCALQPAH
jgi:hypothetical protein